MKKSSGILKAHVIKAKANPQLNTMEKKDGMPVEYQPIKQKHSRVEDSGYNSGVEEVEFDDYPVKQYGEKENANQQSGSKKLSLPNISNRYIKKPSPKSSFLRLP